MSDGVKRYVEEIRAILDRIVDSQLDAVERAAATCALAIGGGGVVHVFGSGHSRIVVEEIWPRYGSFPGFHPIAELSLTYYHQVVGANGQRQAMFLENVPGLAARILRNFAIRPQDALIAVSAGGTSVVTVELAEQVRAAGLKVVAITSVGHSTGSTPRTPNGKRLFEVADTVLDTCTPLGDAAVTVDGLEVPVGPTTTIAGSFLANALKVRTAELLVEAGHPPMVLPSPAMVGKDASDRAFEDAYDEHARRIGPLYLR